MIVEEDEELPENHGIALVEPREILAAVEKKENGVQVGLPVHDNRGKIEGQVVHRSRESLENRGEELENGGDESHVELFGLHVRSDGKPGSSKRPGRID